MNIYMPAYPGFPLQTERLALQPLTPNFSKQLYAYRSLPQVYQYQGWQPATLAEAEIFAQNNSKIKPNTPGTWFQLAVCNKSGHMLGDVGIYFMQDGFQAEIGYSLAPEHWGHGYAQEAVSGVLHYLFSTLQKHRVTASSDPKNQSSIRLLKRLAFRQEAYCVQSYWDGAHWADDCQFALLREEWPAGRAAGT